MYSLIDRCGLVNSEAILVVNLRVVWASEGCSLPIYVSQMTLVRHRRKKTDLMSVKPVPIHRETKMENA